MRYMTTKFTAKIIWIPRNDLLIGIRYYVVNKLIILSIILNIIIINSKDVHRFETWLIIWKNIGTSQSEKLDEALTFKKTYNKYVIQNRINKNYILKAHHILLEEIHITLHKVLTLLTIVFTL